LAIALSIFLLFTENLRKTDNAMAKPCKIPKG
jgi:hypothetical protein